MVQEPEKVHLRYNNKTEEGNPKSIKSGEVVFDVYKSLYHNYTYIINEKDRGGGVIMNQKYWIQNNGLNNGSEPKTNQRVSSLIVFCRKSKSPVLQACQRLAKEKYH